MRKPVLPVASNEWTEDRGSHFNVPRVVSQHISGGWIDHQAQDIRDRFQSAELLISNGTRFGKTLQAAEEALERLTAIREGKGSLDEMRPEQLLSVAELYRLRFVTEQSVSSPDRMKALLQCMNEDALDPGSPGSKAHGRNRFCELFVAARLRTVGLHAAEEEPDLTFDWKGGRIGVAIKRVRSPSQLEKNFRAARDQISKSGMSGIIAIDISPLVAGFRDVAILDRYDDLAVHIEHLDKLVEATIKKLRTQNARVGLAFGVTFFCQAVFYLKETAGFCIHEASMSRRLVPAGTPNALKMLHIGDLLRKPW